MDNVEVFEFANHPNRCAAMDQDGVRCDMVELLAPKYVGYHGDPEVRYDSNESATWVLVVLCPSHRTSYDTERSHEYNINGLRREAR